MREDAADVERAPLIEVFASIQGEGRFVGVPMAFARVAKCPIRCTYCDSPHTYAAPRTCAVRGPGGVRMVANPMEPAEAAELVAEVAWGPIRVVSVTGGEPLLYPAFVRDVAKAWGGPVHLETAALDPAAMQICAPALSHLSADYKLPATLRGGADARAQHRECIAIAVEAGLTVDVKLVLTPDVEGTAVMQALADLEPWRRAVLLVLQPATPFGAVAGRPEPAAVKAWAHAAALAGFDVRVLPQVHPLLGVE
ncbi:MAG: 7-carboxy-7-deazaguanine synthase QueE [Planctomycetota bacterium]